MAESIQDQKRYTLKVGDIVWSDYFNANLRITRIYSDNDWYFELNGKSYKAQTTLSYIENHPLKPESIQDQKVCKVKANSLNNSNKDVKLDQKADEIDEILYDFWCKHRDCKDGCQSTTDYEGESTKQSILQYATKKELEAVFNELDVLSEMQRISKKTTFSYLTKEGESYIQTRIKELIAQLGGKE